MLFSEPKIPQLVWTPKRRKAVLTFQCSSASRKFLNPVRTARRCPRRFRFSALQRAENSSTRMPYRSGASARSFSALQRAENSSTLNPSRRATSLLLFQCSSASRKFLNSYSGPLVWDCTGVSVLFSEPKIPQLARLDRLQRRTGRFQCSSASRKFLNRTPTNGLKIDVGFSALQRAENSSTFECDCFLQYRTCFSALQRAENSSIQQPITDTINVRVSVLFSEPKIPQPTRRPPPSPEW